MRKMDRNGKKPNNLTLFSPVTRKVPLKSKKQLKKARKNLKNPSISTIKEVINEGEKKEERDILVKYHSLDEYEKLKIEEKAVELCCHYEDIPREFLLNLRKVSVKVYYITLKKYIEIAMKDGK
jgi:hypothetical protein